MKFEYLNQTNLNVVKKYMNLVNDIIKNTHSIGFIDGLTVATSKEFIEAVLSKPRTALLLVVEDNKLIGSGLLEETGYPATKHYGKISKIMVDSKHQRKGIGKKIVEELEKKGKEFGYTHILVTTWDIDYIIRFYKNCGYIQVGIRPEFVKYKGKYHDSYNFVKKLVKEQKS